MTTTDIVLAVLVALILIAGIVYVSRFKAKQRAMGIDPDAVPYEAGIAAAKRDKNGKI